MITRPRHHFLIAQWILVVLWNGSPSASADDKAAVAAAKRAAFQKQMTYIDPAFAEGPTTEWKRIYHAALNDRKKWLKLVKAEDDEKTRTTRAGEVVAFSGRYKVEPVTIGALKHPITSEGGCSIFLYRTVAQLNNGKWVKLPEKIQQRRYLLVRGLIPREHDPYDIIACTYLGGLTEQEIIQLVNRSLEF